MATTMKEVDALPQSTGASQASHGPFIQNMFRRQKALETRPGAGQIGQFDSTLGLAGSPHGFQEVMGGAIMRTDFGHTQIVTILRNYSFTGSSLSRGYWQNVYSVVIFDKTTGQYWEEILTRHTSEQDPKVTLPSTYRGVYETNRDQDFSAFPQVQAAKVWAIEYQDTLYFGSPTMGIWQYVPCDFSGRNTNQLNGMQPLVWAPTYGESALVLPVNPSPGLAVAAAAYLDSGGFPTVTSTTVIDNRLTYCSGRSVYFSDPGFPGSIRATNILQVPCEDQLSKIIEFSGNLYLFTRRETWLYQPNVGDVIANGRLTRISGSVGCSSVYGAVQAGSMLFWMDDRGCYTMQGLFDIKPIADTIQSLFDPGVGVANPLTSFLVQQGKTSTTNQQPQTFLYADAQNVVMAYDPLFRQIVMSFPNQNAAWVYQEGQWFYWAFESVANSESLVKATAAIQNLWPLALDGKLYGIAGTETYVPNDQAKVGGISPAGENAPSKSFYLLQFGMGGGIDRTVAAQQDNRTIAGYFEQQYQESVSNGYYRVGRAWRAPDGYGFPANSSGQQNTYVYPVFFSPTTVVDNCKLVLGFDNTNWTPVFTDNTSSTTLDIIIPPERLGGIGGWRLGSGILNQATAQCYDSGTMTPSRTGNLLVLQWNAADAVAAGPAFGNTKMNAAPFRESILCYFGLTKKSGTLSSTCMSAGFYTAASLLYSNYGAGTSKILSTFLWHQAYVPNLHANDDTAQPVDWCCKTDQLGLDGQDQVKSRGMYVHLVDRGVGLTGLDTNWPYSTFNVLSSADMSDYSGQLRDFGVLPATLGSFGSPEHAVTKDNIRERINVPSGTNKGDNAPKEFGNPASQWGQSGTNNGSILVDNQAYDTRAISSHVRGETVSWMLFGFMRSPPERIVLDSVKVTIAEVAGRRRKGR